MSYDIFFAYRSPFAKQVDEAAYQGWFGGRAFYRMCGDEDRQAWYENEDTEVYFCFDYPHPDEAETIGVSFNIGSVKPHTFALEAADEIEAFVKEFDLVTSDGEFSRDDFIRDWNAHNRTSIRSAKRRPRSMPGARLEAIWTWNRDRNVYQEYFAEVAQVACFVPKIIAVDDGAGGALSGVVWNRGIAMALPDVDGALVVPPSREGELRWIPKADLAAILAAYPVQPAGHEYPNLDGERFAVPFAARILSWDSPPPEILSALPAAGEPFRRKGIGWAEVVDEELLSPQP